MQRGTKECRNGEGRKEKEVNKVETRRGGKQDREEEEEGKTRNEGKESE